MGLLKRQLCRLDNCNNSERSSRRFIKSNTSTREAPYQMLGHRSLSSALGHKELYSCHFWLSLLSECLSCYIYVFIVCSTRISWTGAIIGHEPNLLAMALSSGLAMMLLIFTFRTVHVNPALTVAFALTGRIPLIRAIAYILMHCIGAIAAIAFLHTISIKGHAGALGLDNPHSNLNSWQILIVEAVISFVVTLITYATCNYSSYTSSRKLTLDQLGSDCSIQPSYYSCADSPPHDCDNKPTPHGPLSSASKRSVAPIVSLIPSTSISILNQDLPLSNDSNSQTTVTISNMRNNLLSNGLLLGAYNDTASQHEYEYDNHRIYATQQNLRAETSPQIPIEEVMKEESQLLAPNGFSMHITKGQAFVIGLAYTLTSLSGIPASGASLNPARSFGPAFVMNRWDRHWIYWLGPILGAVIAGIFYEFIFNPTRKSSLCYRPKLFHLSAQDVAKVVAKSSRQYQQQQPYHFSQQQQKLSSPATTPAGLQHLNSASYRAQQQQHQQFLHHHQTIQHSPNTRGPSNNLISSNGVFPKPSTRDLTAATTKTTGGTQKPPYLFGGGQTLNPMSYLQQQQQQQDREQQLQQQFLRLTSHGAANFDRNKSSAIVNPLAALNQPNSLHQHQASFNMAAQRSQNQEPGFRQHSEQTEQVHYDDPAWTTTASNRLQQHQRRPTSQQFSQMTMAASTCQGQQRRSLVGPSFVKHRFEMGSSTPMSQRDQHQQPPLRLQGELPANPDKGPIVGLGEKLDDQLYNVLDEDDLHNTKQSNNVAASHLSRLDHEMGDLSTNSTSANGGSDSSRQTGEMVLLFNECSDGSNHSSGSQNGRIKTSANLERSHYYN